MRLSAGTFGVGRIGWPAAAGLALALLMAVALSRGPAIEVGSPFSSPSPAEVESNYGQLPLAFEPNAGRMRDGVDFVTHTAGGSVALVAGGAVLSGEAGDPIAVRIAGGFDSEARPLGKLPGVVNDLTVRTAQGGITNIPTYERVRYPHVYPGIAVDWYGNERTLEYDFRVGGGADPSQIAVRLAGAEDLRIAANGGLVIGTGGDSIRQAPPVAYQPSATGRDSVEVRYALDGDRVNFELGRYDRGRLLVIDPLLLDYSTYVGGAGDDRGSGIAVQPGTQNAFVVGTASAGFDTTPATNPVRPNNQGGSDATVTKLSASGNSLEYSTYIGGNNADTGDDVAVDASGAAYLVGSASTGTNFPLGAATFDGSHNGGIDVFVAKLNPTGDVLEYIGFLGGTGNDISAFSNPSRIALDPSGNAYIAGATASTDFPIVGGIAGEPNDIGDDVFVSKISPAGTSLVYSTYIGGSDDDRLGGIAVDGLGSAHVAGVTESTDFNTVNELELNKTGDDGFVFKLNAAGNALVYSTYIGGAGADDAADVAVDADGRAYVAGDTTSADLTLTSGAHDAVVNARDYFLTVLGPSGTTREYATYVGGTANESATAVDIDPLGNAYILGTTADGANSPESNDLGGASTEGTLSDLYLVELAPDDTAADSDVIYATRVGGDGSESAGSIDVTGDSGFPAYITGFTNASDYPLNLEFEVDADFDGNAQDFVVSKLSQDEANLSVTQTAPAAIDPGDQYEYTLQVENLGPFAATPALLEVVLPNSSRISYRDADSDIRCQPQGILNNVECILGTMPAGASETLTVAVTHVGTAQGTLSSQAIIGSDINDPVGGNNLDTDFTELNVSADLAVAVTDSADPVLIGADYSYTLSLDNLGPLDTVPGAVTLQLPAGVIYRDAASSPACAPGAPGQVVCSGGPLGVADPAQTFGIAVTAPAAAGTLNAAAEVFPGDPDPAAANNTDSESTAVNAPPADGGGGGDSGGAGGDSADTTVPDTSITKSPRKRTFKRTAGFEFTSTEPGSRFECALDKRDFVACATPFSLKRLKFGKHILRVRAIDAAGNIDATPATKTWTVKRKPRRKL